MGKLLAPSHRDEFGQIVMMEVFDELMGTDFFRAHGETVGNRGEARIYDFCEHQSDRRFSSWAFRGLF